MAWFGGNDDEAGGGGGPGGTGGREVGRERGTGRLWPRTLLALLADDFFLVVQTLSVKRGL